MPAFPVQRRSAESQAGRILLLLGQRDRAYFIDLAPE
jgi:hypothetical protein